MDENKNILDKLIDNDGVKFSVTLDVAPEIYIKLFLTIAASVVVSAMAINLLTGVLQK